MARRLTLGVFLLVASLCPSGAPRILAQAPDGPYRVIGSNKWSDEELNRAAADGYRLVAGDAAARVAVFERAGDSVRRSYLHVKNVGKFLKDRKLPAGYRLVAPMFGGGGAVYDAVFEKVEGDELARDYRFVEKGSGGSLRKHFEQGGDGSSGVVAVAALPGAAAIYEVRAEARRAMVIASGNTGTVQKELETAGARGQCIIDGEGLKEVLYVLEECPGGAAAKTYEVISTTKDETFERELTAAAARGMRFVPASLVGIEKRVLGNPYNYERVGVVERSADAAPVTYRLLAVARVPTLGKELDEAAASGFRLVAFSIGPNQIFAVLEKR